MTAFDGRLGRIEAAIAGALDRGDYHPIAVCSAVERYYQAAGALVPDMNPRRLGYYRPNDTVPEYGPVHSVDHWLSQVERPAPLAGVQAELLRCGWHALHWSGLAQRDWQTTCRLMDLHYGDYTTWEHEWWLDTYGLWIPNYWRDHPVVGPDVLAAMGFGPAELALLAATDG
jgi:hypothetical protein